jgi:hypothetical protein
VVIIHFYWTELHQIIVASPLQLLFKAVLLFQWIWKFVARSANRPVTLFDAAKLHGKFTFNSSCNDLPTLLLSAKYSNLRKTGTRVVVIVIEAEGPYVVFFFWRKRFGMQTMRVPVGRVPQNKTHM